MQTRVPKTQKRYVYNTSTGEYQSIITGCGVPSVPYISTVAVSNANWNATWTIPHGCRALEIKLRAESAADLKISTDVSGSPYFTIRWAAGYVESYKIEEMYGEQQGTALYFQTSAGTGTVEILYWMDGGECHTPS